MITDLHYKPAEVPEGCFRISPSAFAKFIQTPHSWYRSEVLGEKTFEYNTATVLGTVVHYCAYCAATEKTPDMHMINAYIESFEENEDYCKQEVYSQFKLMATTLVNEYTLKHSSNFIMAETNISTVVKEGFAAAGSIDVLQGIKTDCMPVDYKTYSSKTKPSSIPLHYKYQLLVYAWILRKNGYNPTRIRLVYVNRYIDGGISEKTNKPLKSYPPEVTVLTDNITPEDFDFIEGLLVLACDAMIATREHPELTHVIWHDPRLRVER